MTNEEMEVFNEISASGPPLEFKGWSYPVPVGSYLIGGSFRVTINKKPNWFNRKMCKLILGFEWMDAK